MHKETVLFMMKPAWGAVRSHVRRHVVGLCKRRVRWNAVSEKLICRWSCL